jgi:hypothetical protein
MPPFSTKSRSAWALACKKAAKSSTKKDTTPYSKVIRATRRLTIKKMASKGNPPQGNPVDYNDVIDAVLARDRSFDTNRLGGTTSRGVDPSSSVREGKTSH